MRAYSEKRVPHRYPPTASTQPRLSTNDRVSIVVPYCPASHCVLVLPQIPSYFSQSVHWLLGKEKVRDAHAKNPLDLATSPIFCFAHFTHPIPSVALTPPHHQLALLDYCPHCVASRAPMLRSPTPIKQCLPRHCEGHVRREKHTKTLAHMSRKSFPRHPPLFRLSDTLATFNSSLSLVHSIMCIANHLPCHVPQHSP